MMLDKVWITKDQNSIDFKLLICYWKSVGSEYWWSIAGFPVDQEWDCVKLIIGQSLDQQ